MENHPTPHDTETARSRYPSGAFPFECLSIPVPGKDSGSQARSCYPLSASSVRSYIWDKHPTPHDTEPARSRYPSGAFPFECLSIPVPGKDSGSQARSCYPLSASSVRSYIWDKHPTPHDTEPECRLYAKEGSYTTFMPLLAAEYSDVNIPVIINSELDSCYWEDPVLVTHDGLIHGGIGTAYFVCYLKPDNPLHGSSDFHYGRIVEFIDFASSGIRANIVACLRAGARNGCAARFAEAADNTELKRAMDHLNKCLASNKDSYLVGHSITLADIVLTCVLYHGFTQLMPKSFTSEFPHVERYFWTLVDQPNYKKILGEVKQIESFQSKNMVLNICRKIVAPFLEYPEMWHVPAQPKEAAKSKPKDEPKKEAEKEEPKPEAGVEEEAPKPKLSPKGSQMIEDHEPFGA